VRPIPPLPPRPRTGRQLSSLKLAASIRRPRGRASLLGRRFSFPLIACIFALLSRSVSSPRRVLFRAMLATDRPNNLPHRSNTTTRTTNNHQTPPQPPTPPPVIVFICIFSLFICKGGRQDSPHHKSLRAHLSAWSHFHSFLISLIGNEPQVSLYNHPYLYLTFFRDFFANPYHSSQFAPPLRRIPLPRRREAFLSDYGPFSDIKVSRLFQISPLFLIVYLLISIKRVLF